MPIYEYISGSRELNCSYCADGFEALQKASEVPKTTCPKCGGTIRKQVSKCHSAMIESSIHQTNVENKIKDHEKAGQWGHAAELADKHAEKTKDKNLKTRALENYSKAGYDTNTLLKHDKS